MGLYNHEEFAKQSRKSAAKLIGAKKVKKAPASPLIKKVAKAATVKNAAPKKTAAKKDSAKSLSVKTAKKVIAKNKFSLNAIWR